VAKSRIVDAVADAVVRAEIAVVRTGRKAVAAINSRTRKKTAARKVVSKAKRAVRSAKSTVRSAKSTVRSAKSTVRKAAKKAAKRVRRR
jgi:hypothetical protein